MPFFENFWNNQGLRISLFPINNTPALKPDALTDFIEMVDTKSNDLFKFIKIK